MKENPHSNIVQFYNSYLVGEELWVVMEYVNGGALNNTIQKSRFVFTLHVNRERGRERERERERPSMCEKVCKSVCVCVCVCVCLFGFSTLSDTQEHTVKSW